jgi:hypothetical protein
MPSRDSSEGFFPNSGIRRVRSSTALMRFAGSVLGRGFAVDGGTYARQEENAIGDLLVSQYWAQGGSDATENGRCLYSKCANSGCCFSCFPCLIVIYGLIALKRIHRSTPHLITTHHLCGRCSVLIPPLAVCKEFTAWVQGTSWL